MKKHPYRLSSLSFSTILPAILACLLAAYACDKKQEEDDAPKPVDGPVKVYSLYVNGTPAQLDEATSTFTVTLPTTTDFSECDLKINSEAMFIYHEDSRIGAEVHGVDLSSPIRLQLYTGNMVRQVYKVQARNTGLPIVRISTPGGRNITSKENWMEGAHMRIEMPLGEVDYEGTLSIRGRGNSTWNYPKKPYALKLDKKDGVLGMPNGKRWILLANWKDRTILRNDAAFWLSRHTSLPYTVRGRFVELELNGTHQGNYYLCEQIKIGKDRVDVDEMDPLEKDPALITGGYLLEVDTYFDEKNKFIFPNFFNLPWMVKEPDEEDISQEALAYIKDYIRNLEVLMKNTVRVRNHEYEEFFDVDTAIDFLLVNELTMNNDFYNTWPWAGPHSVYMYKQRDGKLFSGPVWDFDFHTFCPQFTSSWTGLDKTLFYPALIKDTKFKDALRKRWNEQKDDLRGLPDYIDEMVELLRVSEEINHAKWPIVNNPENGDEELTYGQAIYRMKKAFVDKWEWMDGKIAKL